MTAELHHREFSAGNLQIRQADDGFHYAEGVAVPFMVPTEITEFRNDGPIRYREQFAAGAFARALRAPHRVTLVYGHSDQFSERLGYVVSFVEDPDVGLRMRAKLDRSRAEQAIDALTSSHSALSVAFASIVPRAGTEQPGALVTRRSVHLAHIGCVTQGAYDAAQLTSVRAGDDPDPTEAEVAEAEQERQAKELSDWVDSLAAEDPWAHLRQPR